jgi:hypothetical protein
LKTFHVLSEICVKKFFLVHLFPFSLLHIPYDSWIFYFDLKLYFFLFFNSFFFFFLIYVGCPGQLTRTTTIPHGPLDILQAQEQVRHRGGDRRAHRGSNPGRGRNKSHGWPQQLDPQVQMRSILKFKEKGEKIVYLLQVLSQKSNILTCNEI